DSGAPWPAQDRGMPPAAGPPEAPRWLARAADRRPGASVLLAGRPGPARPAPGAADPPAGDARALGRELFVRPGRASDPRCQGGAGLGPVYNATSCLDCHNQGGPGGGGPVDRNVELATGVGYMASPDTPVVVNGNVVAGNIGVGMVSTKPVQ